MSGIHEGYAFDMRYCVPLGLDRFTGHAVQLPAEMMNRHGLISGATGTGKTVAIREIIEWLSMHGINTLTLDGKGDLSGLSREGELSGKLLERAQDLGQVDNIEAEDDWWKATSTPVTYLALGGNGAGVDVKIPVGTFACGSLAKLLKLTAQQYAALENAWGAVKADSTQPVETLEDLCDVIRGEEADESRPLTESMASRILARIQTFDRKNPGLFGGPGFDVFDLVRKDEGEEWGRVSVIDSTEYSEEPEILTTFLLWALERLAAELPEVGDSEIKLVCFFDEAHLLFEDAPKEFVSKVLRTIRTLRSKGVGVFFVTQSADDIPERILNQLANRIQFALRAFTPKQKAMVHRTAETFPMSSTYDVEKELTAMGKGEGLVCVIDDEGYPTPTVVVRFYVPRTSMEVLSEHERRHVAESTELYAKYLDLAEQHAENLRQANRVVPFPAVVRAPKAPQQPASRPAAPAAGAGAVRDLVSRLSGSQRRSRVSAADNGSEPDDFEGFPPQDYDTEADGPWSTSAEG